jgi:AraC-like DNA-binding protein
MSLPAPSTSSLSLRRYGASPGSHSHAHYQVLWGWRGALELDIEGRGARVTTGRVAVIPPGARHDFWAGREAAQCFVLDSVEAQLEPFAGRVIEGPPSLPRLLEFLQAEARPRLLQAAVPLLLDSLWCSEESWRAVPVSRGRAIDWPALTAWVEAHMAEALDVARLAAQVHLSASQFAARCVEQWGLPPLAWVRGLRLAAARRWRAQGLPVTEVALRCGYRSPSALTAALRRVG